MNTSKAGNKYIKLRMGKPKADQPPAKPKAQPSNLGDMDDDVPF
jgi:hypothetical protein